MQKMIIKTQPLVSIITPIYNEADHLAECIESILNQTYTNWNYTIIDNCSEDDSVKIALQYSAHDSRIRIIKNREFLEVIGNHNNALRHISTSSKYCKIVFGDDWLYPECIEKMITLAEKHPSVGIVGAYGICHDRVVWSGLNYFSDVVTGREICRRLFLDGLYVFGSATSLLYRSDIVKSRDPFYNENNLHCDSETCIEILKRWDFGFVHQVLTFHRERQKSMSAFSEDANTYIAGKLHELVAHGHEFLMPEEYRSCVRRMVAGYYRNLSGALMRGRGRRFWEFHRKALTNAGIGFSWARIGGVAAIQLFRALLNPEQSIRKAWHIAEEIRSKRRAR
jgi:glycosyltransferase involved in cell wall biosynthesis